MDMSDPWVAAWTTFDSLEKLEECVFALMAKSDDMAELEERLKATVSPPPNFLTPGRGHSSLNIAAISSRLVPV